MIIVSAGSRRWPFAAEILHLSSNFWEGQAMHIAKYYNLPLAQEIKPLWVHTFTNNNHWDTKRLSLCGSTMCLVEELVWQPRTPDSQSPGFELQMPYCQSY